MGYYWHNNLLKSLNLNINLWNSFINMAMVAELLSSYIYGIIIWYMSFSWTFNIIGRQNYQYKNNMLQGIYVMEL